jgi:hypothetical protein
MKSLNELTELYIGAFENKDLVGVEQLFHENATLIDPNVSVTGRNDLTIAIRNIFESFVKLEFNVRNIYYDRSTSIVEFELILDGDSYIGVDIIDWDNGKIIKLRAYLYKL